MTGLDGQREKGKTVLSPRQQQDAVHDDPDENFDDLTMEYSPQLPFGLTGTANSSFPCVNIDSLFGESPLRVEAGTSTELMQGLNMPTTSEFVENSNGNLYDDLELEQTADSDDVSDLIEIPERLADVSMPHDSTEW